MQIDLSTPQPRADLLAPEPRDLPGILAAQSSFSSILGRAGADPHRSPVDKAREAAEQFVAQTLILPMLKQFRDSDRTPPPFAPSQGEKQFRALMDAELAQRIAKAQRFPLVDRLAQDLLKKAAAAAHSSP
jgi:Rod binding domain-containing protein